MLVRSAESREVRHAPAFLSLGNKDLRRWLDGPTWTWRHRFGPLHAFNISLVSPGADGRVAQDPVCRITSSTRVARGTYSADRLAQAKVTLNALVPGDMRAATLQACHLLLAVHADPSSSLSHDVHESGHKHYVGRFVRLPAAGESMQVVDWYRRRRCRGFATKLSRTRGPTAFAVFLSSNLLPEAEPHHGVQHNMTTESSTTCDQLFSSAEDLQGQMASTCRTRPDCNRGVQHHTHSVNEWDVATDRSSMRGALDAFFLRR